MSSLFLYYSSFSFLGQNLSLTLKLIDSARQASQQAPDTLLSLPLQNQITGQLPQSVLHMGSGHWTQVLLFVQLDYDWIILRIYPTVSLAIYPLEGTSVDATNWLLWIVRRVAREIHTLYVDCDYFSTYLPVVETDHLAVLQLIFEGLHTDFHSVCTKLHSHQCVSVHFS